MRIQCRLCGYRRAARARLRCAVPRRRAVGMVCSWWRPYSAAQSSIVRALTVPLALRGYVAMPPHGGGDFDHGDVHFNSSRVFVAHTANGTIEVIHGERQELDQTLPGCPAGSGVLCAQGDCGLVFAAARGAGKVLVLD